VANKIDLPGAPERLEVLRDMYGARFPMHVISAEHGTGLEELRAAIYQFLKVIRVYTKKPGKPADMTSPYTVPEGSTVSDLAAHRHRHVPHDLSDHLRRCHLAQTGFGPEDQPMPQHRKRHSLHVVRQHKAAARHCRQRLARAEERDRGPRAAAQLHLVMLPR